MNKNPDLKKRLQTAAVLIAVVVLLGAFASISVTGSRIFATLGLFAILTATFEYFSVRKTFTITDSKLSSAIALGIILIPVMFSYSLAVYALPNCSVVAIIPFIASTVAIFSLALIWNFCVSFKYSSDLTLFSKILCTDLLAYALLSVGGSALLLMSVAYPAEVLLLIFLVAVADSSAYFTGRQFGKAKIAALVSPSKTVVGTLAALFITALIAVVLSLIFVDQNLLHNFVLAFLVAFCSQAGDFAKSIIKRIFGTKDFSRILPGHGGIFDRIDGLLGAAPLFLIFLLCR